MDLQVLVSTMHQVDHSLLNKMNISSNSIIINQCDRNEVEDFQYRGFDIKYISYDERGVGLSRNNALMRASADICLFSDEDVKYVDDYNKIIVRAFEDNPRADIIIFNLISTNIERPMFEIKKHNRVRWFECLKYGAVRIAVRTSKLRQANIYFSLLFGGGAMYSSGEDSIFIAECIRKGLRVYTNPSVIGYVSQEESTWFKGYTNKYFIDKGVLFASLSKRLKKLLCLQYVIRHHAQFNNEKTAREAYKLMLQGVDKIRRKNNE